MATTTSRKVLVPLATLLAAGAVAVGSGATWTSTTSNSVSVTAGTLLHSNDREDAVLTLDNIKPGDTMTGEVVVANTGTTDSTMVLTSSAETSGFSDDLTIEISNGSTSVFSGTFNELVADGVDETPVDFLADDEDTTPADEATSLTYTFVVTLAATAAGPDQNVDQGKTAGATFTWTQTQVDGESLTENWIS